ncbi:uncharacterized protein LOC106779254 isoform X1 [Vigna radiata var. radiata]|uniref:Uncharacterized protein LOC106779254 isoform X1 n=2 Tax=Vigna radiata var. radiata TaxID=3916 RepID=A0A1S3VWS4_VIGRR|nr:uncharacterized protein LOC106779254 isoform X1 [Vigna radiata var. radiata]
MTKLLILKRFNLVVQRSQITIGALTNKDFKRKAMASAIGSRVESFRNSPLLRFSLNFLRASSSASFSTSSAVSSAQNPKKSKRRKKKNLFEVAQFLPNWGIGYHMAKSHWNEVSYEITKLNLYKDGRHGKAWGIAHKNGLPIADAPKKISGVHKRCWKFLPDVVKASESSTNLTSPTDTALKVETEAS